MTMTLALLAGCGSSPPPSAPTTPAPVASAPPPAPAPTDATDAPAAPEVIVLAHGLGEIDDLVAMGDNLYIAHKKSLVTRMPSGGGAGTDIATFEGQATADAIATSEEGTYVLITAIGEDATKNGYAGQGSLFFLPAKGGDAQPLAQGFRHGTSMLVDDKMVRWVGLKGDGDKAAWALFSAPRKTGKPLTSAVIGEAPAAAKIATDKKTARLVAEVNGSALVSWDDGAIVLHPFDHTVKSPPALALGDYAFTDRRVTVSGDRGVIGGTAVHEGKPVTVVGTFSLGAGSQALTPLATIDAGSTINGVAFAGDDVLYSVTPSKDVHDKHGSIVRIAASDKKSTTLATDQFQPTKIFPTPRGYVWMDTGANEAGDPDGTLVLLPK